MIQKERKDREKESAKRKEIKMVVKKKEEALGALCADHSVLYQINGFTSQAPRTWRSPN
jgi:hypothetical protein